eukprot:4278782-Amphidinium_carterae.1
MIQVRIAWLNKSASHFRMVAQPRLTMRKSARLVTMDRATVEVYEEEREIDNVYKDVEEREIDNVYKDEEERES